MCARYSLFLSKPEREFLALLEEAMENAGRQLKLEEVFPTDFAPVVVKREGKKQPTGMAWGFPPFHQGQRPIINVRSETAQEKNYFKKAVRTGRCVVLTTGFYEWAESSGGKKVKYVFNLPDENRLYLAGIHRRCVITGKDGKQREEERFSILTTQANGSVRDIHHRMPVVLRPGECNRWLDDNEDFARFFDRSGVPLLHIPA